MPRNGEFVPFERPRLPAHLEKVDRASRRQWSELARDGILQAIDATGLRQLIAAGETEFLNLARLTYKNQDFEEVDLLRIWGGLVQAHKALPPPEDSFEGITVTDGLTAPTRTH